MKGKIGGWNFNKFEVSEWQQHHKRNLKEINTLAKYFCSTYIPDGSQDTLRTKRILHISKKKISTLINVKYQTDI